MEALLQGVTKIVCMIILSISIVLAFRMQDDHFFSDIPSTASVVTAQTDSSDEQWMLLHSDNYSYLVPKYLSSVYIQTVSWPPRVSTATTYSCKGVDSQEFRSGQTTYCVTTSKKDKISDYTIVLNNPLLTFDFSLEHKHCSNFNEPYQSDCVFETSTQFLFPTISRIVDSVQSL